MLSLPSSLLGHILVALSVIGSSFGSGSDAPAPTNITKFMDATPSVSESSAPVIRMARRRPTTTTLDSFTAQRRPQGQVFISVDASVARGRRGLIPLAGGTVRFTYRLPGQSWVQLGQGALENTTTAPNGEVHFDALLTIPAGTQVEWRVVFRRQSVGGRNYKRSKYDFFRTV